MFRSLPLHGVHGPRGCPQPGSAPGPLAVTALLSLIRPEHAMSCVLVDRASVGVGEVFLRYLHTHPQLPSPPVHLSRHTQPPPGTRSLCGLGLPSSSGRLLNKQTFLYGMVGFLETGKQRGWRGCRERPNRKRRQLHIVGLWEHCRCVLRGHWWGQSSPCSSYKWAF